MHFKLIRNHSTLDFKLNIIKNNYFLIKLYFLIIKMIQSFVPLYTRLVIS